MSSWATIHIAKLRCGETVLFRPRGHSMMPRIRSGALCTVEPTSLHPLIEVGDVVLCTVKGRDYLHMVYSVKQVGDDSHFLIGNAKGHVNGWVGPNKIHGKLVGVAL